MRFDPLLRLVFQQELRFAYQRTDAGCAGNGANQSEGSSETGEGAYQAGVQSRLLALPQMLRYIEVIRFTLFQPLWRALVKSRVKKQLPVGRDTREKPCEHSAH